MTLSIYLLDYVNGKFITPYKYSGDFEINALINVINFILINFELCLLISLLMSYLFNRRIYNTIQVLTASIASNFIGAFIFLYFIYISNSVSNKTLIISGITTLIASGLSLNVLTHLINRIDLLSRKNIPLKKIAPAAVILLLLLLGTFIIAKLTIKQIGGFG